MLPSLFTENLLDDFFRFPMPRAFQADHYSHNLMDTDVKDTDGAYEIAVNLPGFKKEDVQCELKNGYLTIDATTNSNSDMQDENSRYIRRERYHGACRRSFYVGPHTKKSDIKAKFEDGVLTLIVPKMDTQPQIEEHHAISIE